MEIEKYMINPVTSTSVATNGAEDTAGSSLNRFNINGNNEPTRQPHKTTPVSVMPTVHNLQ